MSDIAHGSKSGHGEDPWQQRPAGYHGRRSMSPAPRVGVWRPRRSQRCAVAEPSSATAHKLLACSGLGNEAELAESGDAVVEADLLRDEAVLDLQDGGAREPHHLAGIRRQ
jgi:hypothetical protein